MSVGAFLINLDGSDTRRQAAVAQLETLGLDWVRVPAVDGRGLPVSTFDAYDDAAARRYMGRSMTGGEIACHLSHAKAAQAFLDSDHALGLVLEDDFTLTDGAVEAMGPVLDWLSGDDAPAWELVNLGAHKRKISTPFAEVAGRTVLRAHYFPMLGTAILMTRDAAARLVADSAHITCPVDNHYRHWQTRTGRGLSVWPPLFRAGDHPSDIDARTRRADKTQRRATYGLAKQRRLWVDKAIAVAHKMGLAGRG